MDPVFLDTWKPVKRVEYDILFDRDYSVEAIGKCFILGPMMVDAETNHLMLARTMGDFWVFEEY